ncbi:MAG: DUF3106 domain-containing protein [Syntrophaceae bacterium]|nr:DUF3106 domain-containing protein [Syntrophaceae bacterium]
MRSRTAILVAMLTLFLAECLGPGRRHLLGPAHPEEQKTLKPFQDRWNSMSPERQERLRKGVDRWQRMTPAEREQANQRYQKWRELPPERRETILRGYEDFRRLPRRAAAPSRTLAVVPPASAGAEGVAPREVPTAVPGSAGIAAREVSTAIRGTATGCPQGRLSGPGAAQPALAARRQGQRRQPGEKKLLRPPVNRQPFPSFFSQRRQSHS